MKKKPDDLEMLAEYDFSGGEGGKYAKRYAEGTNVVVSDPDEGEARMPKISMFYGILIRMFFRDIEKHHVPHVHADYQGQVAVY